MRGAGAEEAVPLLLRELVGAGYRDGKPMHDGRSYQVQFAVSGLMRIGYSSLAPFIVAGLEVSECHTLVAGPLEALSLQDLGALRPALSRPGCNSHALSRWAEAVSRKGPRAAPLLLDALKELAPRNALLSLNRPDHLALPEPEAWKAIAGEFGEFVAGKGGHVGRSFFLAAAVRHPNPATRPALLRIAEKARAEKLPGYARDATVALAELGDAAALAALVDEPLEFSIRDVPPGRLPAYEAAVAAALEKYLKEHGCADLEKRAIVPAFSVTRPEVAKSLSAAIRGCPGETVARAVERLDDLASGAPFSALLSRTAKLAQEYKTQPYPRPGYESLAAVFPDDMVAVAEPAWRKRGEQWAMTWLMNGVPERALALAPLHWEDLPEARRVELVRMICERRLSGEQALQLALGDCSPWVRREAARAVECAAALRP